MACLIPKSGKGITCHEKEFCQCDIESLEAENAKLEAKCCALYETAQGFEAERDQFKTLVEKGEGRIKKIVDDSLRRTAMRLKTRIAELEAQRTEAPGLRKAIEIVQYRAKVANLNISALTAFREALVFLEAAAQRAERGEHPDASTPVAALDAAGRE